MQKVLPPEKDGKADSMAESLIIPPPEPPKNLTLAEGQALRVGSVVIYTLGEIVQDSPFFHTASYIYPRGFRSSRIFWSATKPHARSFWVTNILGKEEEQPAKKPIEGDPSRVCLAVGARVCD